MKKVPHVNLLYQVLSCRRLEFLFLYRY